MKAPGFEDLLDPAVYDRIMKSLHHQEGDRVPIWDLVDNWAVYQHFAPGEADLTKAAAAVFHGLGIDLCRIYFWPLSPDEEGTVLRQGEDREWQVRARTRWATRRSYNTLEDLAKFQPIEPDEERIRDEEIPAYLAAREAFAPRTMLVPPVPLGCGFHAAYDLLGLELFCIAVHDARADLERIIRCINADRVARAKAFAEAKVCPIYFIDDDIAYKHKMMFSPRVMRELFFPCLAAVCRPLKEAGIKVIFHSDGDVTPIIDDLIEAGIDGLNPIEPMAGMDIGYVKRRWGDRLVLVGNVDCSQTIPRGTPEDIRKAVRECVRAASPGGGHFIGSSSEIVPATPLENVIAFYEACREYGTYPVRI
jgi:uroporphyrinogen decarboxylase